MASLNVGNLGEYLREQRRNAQLSLRQLADAAGVSNPYLSQIERGLRKPSAEVLQQVAKALRISAETLYVRAGILDAERDRDDVETRAVILADPSLNERQKQVLLQIYESFRKENGFEVAAAAAGDEAAKASAPRAPGAPDSEDGAPADARAARDTPDVPETSGAHDDRTGAEAGAGAGADSGRSGSRAADGGGARSRRTTRRGN